ncbi:MAG: hypothetical protein H7318_09870 [Oligoflexus sp.]|nr:hypothetical protein [Oligoflexus sp.]
MMQSLRRKSAVQSWSQFKLTLLLTVLVAIQTSCATHSACDLDAIYKITATECANKPCPPGNPQQGPGSGKSTHQGADVFELKEGMFDSYRSVVYTPASPSPKTAPVILFLHGYFDSTPEKYDAMLKHYARKGFIVIYPSYGSPIGPKDWAKNAEEAWKRAIAFLNKDGHVKPDLTRVAYIGHSIGGLLSLHLAEKQSSSNLPAIPVPKLIISMEAAGTPSIAYPYIAIDDLSKIPRETKLVLIMAEETYRHREEEKDRCENKNPEPSKTCDGFITSRNIYQKTTQIPAEQKTAILIPSDIRGQSGLRSEHNGVQGECDSAGKPLDAIDTWGYWKYTVEALDQSLLSDSKDLPFLRSDRLRSNGSWSDGKPAKQAQSLDSCFARNTCPPN